MKTETQAQVFEYIEKTGGSSPAKIAEHLGISTQMVHRHLKSLLKDGRISKSGSAPKVIYQSLATNAP